MFDDAADRRLPRIGHQEECNRDGRDRHGLAGRSLEAPGGGLIKRAHYQPQRRPDRMWGTGGIDQEGAEQGLGHPSWS